MFRPANEETARILKENSEQLNRKQLARHKRQLVYDYILRTPSAKNNVDLARAAGYDMDQGSQSAEYIAGSQFICTMIRRGYIIRDDSNPFDVKYYIGGKELVDSDLWSEPVTVEKTNEESREDILDNTNDLGTADDIRYDVMLTLRLNGNCATLDIDQQTLDEIIEKIKSISKLI